MAKDKFITVDATEIHDDTSSTHPITRQYATHITTPDLLPQWPAEPLPLTPEPTTERWLLLFDIALCVTPLALIAKAILCIVAYTIDRGNTGYLFDQVHAVTIYLVRFNHQLTTIFTVVFVLIITTFVRRLALYMAQEGASIAKLEQLQASISLPGTLKAIWCLRSFGRTSCALLFLWGWFYLGSQATTSEYEYRTSAPAQRLPMAYFSPKKPSLFYGNNSTAPVSDIDISNINSMSNAFSSVQSSGGNEPVTHDLNGAALVPYLRRDGSSVNQGFISPALKEDRYGYFDVSEASKLEYASFIGTTIFTNIAYNDFGLQINGVDGTYTSNSTYLNVTCEVPDVRNASAFPDGVHRQAQASINMTAQIVHQPLGPQDPPPTFDVFFRYNDSGPVAHTTCHLQLVNVQLKVSCLAGNCGAKKMRFMDSSPINRTAFDNRDFATTFLENLLSSNGMPAGYFAPWSAIPQNGVASSGIVRSILNGFGDFASNVLDAPPMNLGPELRPGGFVQSWLSVSVTTIINTYYDASIDPLQGSWEDPLLLENSTVPGIGLELPPSPEWYTGTFKGNLYAPQYVLSIPWVIVDLISCQILLLAAVASTWLRKRTLAPDIFGYVSSLTRDNPHLNLPDGGSTMSGLERARALKKVKVRIGDVADENGVGKVGLRYAESELENMEMAHLKRDRHYV